jgi:propanol-preferring alcohol dehydrogenase
MRAMLFEAPGQPLRSVVVADPSPGSDQVLVKVGACGLCRTDLHVVDGELQHPKLPLIPGHQVVGEVVEVGGAVETIRAGDRVGVPWLGWTCGICEFCTTGRADPRFCFPIDRSFSDIEAAPLLCAGLIGYRSLRMAGDGLRLGLYGFGSSAHLVAQVARFQGRRVFAITRPGDVASQQFALHLGAVWAGGTDEPLPEQLDAAIIFAPVGALVPLALGAVRKGGTVVCAGIHMSEIPAFSYDLLWGERTLRSVANLTRLDGNEFLAIAHQIPVHAAVETLSLDQANVALSRLRAGDVQGALVLTIP